jgi:hypothetical protein
MLKKTELHRGIQKQRLFYPLFLSPHSQQVLEKQLMRHAPGSGRTSKFQKPFIHAAHPSPHCGKIKLKVFQGR